MSWPGKSTRARLATAKAQPRGKAVVVPPPPRVVAPIRAPTAHVAPAAPAALAEPAAPVARCVLSPPRAASASVVLGLRTGPPVDATQAPRVPKAPRAPPSTDKLRSELLAVVTEERACYAEMAPW